MPERFNISRMEDHKGVTVSVRMTYSLISTFSLVRHFTKTTSFITIECRYSFDCCCHNSFPFFILFRCKDTHFSSFSPNFSLTISFSFIHQHLPVLRHPFHADVHLLTRGVVEELHLGFALGIGGDVRLPPDGAAQMVRRKSAMGGITL